jgi:recombination protein RecT
MNQNKQDIENSKLANLRKLLFLPDNFNLIKDSCRHGSTPENVINEALICARLTPKLLDCAPFSWVNSLVDAAIMGLPMTGQSGKAWLTKRWSGAHQANLAQYMLGWRGMLDIVYRTQLFKRIDAGVVYRGDEFHYERGMNQHLKHAPNMTGNRKDENVVGFYVEGLLTNGEFKFEVMSIDEVKKIRDNYAVDKSGKVSDTWRDHFTEQGKKTVMRRFWKWLPDHEELQIAEAVDNANNPIVTQPAVVLTPDLTGNEKLKAAIAKPESESKPESKPADTSGDASLESMEPQAEPGQPMAGVVKGAVPGSPEWHLEQAKRAKDAMTGLDPADMPPGHNKDKATNELFL